MREEVEAGNIGSTAGESDVLDPNWVGDQIIDTLDPVYFARTLVNAGMKAAANPVGVGTALLKAAASAMKVGAATMAKAAKTADPESQAPVQPRPKDHRWTSTAWHDNPYFFGLQQTYLLTRNLADDLIDAANLDEAEDRKAKFAASFAFDALAPTNMLLTNPDALAKAAATGGASVVKGAANMLHDLRHNDGWPSKVDDSGFEPGLNMALTPGKVVYRSDLIEVMQYEPQTEKVYEIPMLFCPPWINKYYIMDLAPQKSLIEWAVQHGHTCFTISYRNPDGSMRDTSFEDYLRQGPLDALRVVREITGQTKVNTVNVCLGGTLSAIAMAHGVATGDQPIQHRHVLEHPDRLLRPRCAGSVHRRTHRGRTRTQDGRPGLSGGQRDGPHLRRHPSQRPDLPVRGEQLAAGRGSPGVRPAGLEQRQHPDAGPHAQQLPAPLLPPQRVCQRRLRGGRNRRCTPPTSSRMPTCCRPSTTTSCRGRRPTAPPPCSAATTASCSAPPATLPGSSTRPAPRPATGPTTTSRTRLRYGWRAPNSTSKRGGKTGPLGSASGPARRLALPNSWAARHMGRWRMPRAYT